MLYESKMCVLLTGLCCDFQVTCCDKPVSSRSENCIPISIPKDDPFWGPKGKTCMELRRSKAIKAGQCGKRVHADMLA